MISMNIFERNYKSNFMRKLSLLFGLILIANFSFSQTAQKGAIVNKFSGKKTNVSYSRVLSAKNDSTFSTKYSIYNAKGDTLYKLVLKHYAGQRSIRLDATDVSRTVTTQPVSIDYHYYNSGMVFNNVSFLDTAADAIKMFDFALYFQDTSRTYMSVNALTINDSLNLNLDKIFKAVINEHNKIIKGLAASPVLGKLLMKQEKLVSKRLTALEKSNNESGAKIKALNDQTEKLSNDVKACKNASESMVVNNDSLSRNLYSLKYFPNTYPTEKKDAWDLKIDSTIYKHCAEYFFENTDIKFVIKVTVDTNGVVTATDLTYPASVSALSTKDNYLFTVLTGMIKKETFTPNKVDIYGKKFSVKTSIEKDLFISIKNRKEKILYTDKDNVVYNETKIALPADVKAQFNAKLYAGAKADKYGAKIISFTVNKFVKEIVKEVEF